ncbi:MAG TPA: hypothetical protein VMB80_14705 [Candidatus Acidoferrum sp.]|nr:hypothetical protein [Candidatus Acidoferrum sp.]
MLCDSCHKREATRHVTVIVGDMMQKRDFCAECFEADSPSVAAGAVDQSGARCEYCGGQPCAGAADFLALGTVIPQMKFMCVPCSLEYQRYLQQELEAGPGDLTQQQQLDAIRKLRERANAHMRQWAAEGGAR